MGGGCGGGGVRRSAWGWGPHAAHMGESMGPGPWHGVGPWQRKTTYSNRKFDIIDFNKWIFNTYF